ncbi:Protein EARLY FLOWERING 4 [Camellia lanceoleosa]|uniref:Protein EARLY FLOWERING 4 n=1 Tax=Camellia lanceoleosa TaxID=1840588 RepID=A0ACC0I1C2_9ERIC|nr:Protein EARLY FLOWERING 4 [Camellia lanceoleosa]
MTKMPRLSRPLPLIVSPENRLRDVDAPENRPDREKQERENRTEQRKRRRRKKKKKLWDSRRKEEENTERGERKVNGEGERPQRQGKVKRGEAAVRSGSFRPRQYRRRPILFRRSLWNRALIQQVNENHQSKMPDDLVKNVALIREINSNISKVISLYSNLSVDFSNIVQQQRTINNDDHVEKSAGGVVWLYIFF